MLELFFNAVAGVVVEHLRRAASEFFPSKYSVGMSLDSLLTFDRVALLYSLSQLATHKTSKEWLLRNLLEKVSYRKFLFSNTASFTGTTSHLDLNKVLPILDPSFLVNNVPGVIFSFITEV